MSINAQGIARVEAEVVDISVLLTTGLKGIHAFLGQTEKGEEGKTVLVGSWTEYKKHFGGLLATSDFPLLCKRALDRGCKLRIGRALHYTDVTDKATVTGTKSTGTIVDSATFTAKSIGVLHYKVVVTAAISGISGLFDIVTYASNDAVGTNLEELGRATDLNETLTAQDIVKYNASNPDVAMATAMAGVELVAGNVMVTGGTATGTLTDQDYTGDSAAGTGIHVFDNHSDFVRISVPAIANNVVDLALANYAIQRQDCRAILRTPIGISGQTAVDYRECAGLYDGTAIDTWLASMIFGGIHVTHPVTGASTHITSLADVAGGMAAKDNVAYEWFSAAGPQRGKLINLIGVDYNLGTPARATEANLVDVRGINPVIEDDTFGPVYWGNGTLQKANTLLKHENVADLVIFILRAVKPLSKIELFNPNDVETWKAIHRKVRPLLETVKKKRGIWDYKYEGDQDAETIADVKVNDPNDIDAGKYVFIIWIKPKVGMKYVGIKVAVTNSGVSFEEVAEQTTL